MSDQNHRVELKPTRRWPTAVQAAQFEHVAQGPAFADLVRGRWVPDAATPHVVLPKLGTYGPSPQHLMVGDWLVQRKNGMWERMSPAMYQERYEPPGSEPVPLDQLVTTLPDPVQFRRRLMAAMRQNYAVKAADQVVNTVEDTFEVQLFLARGIELCKQYASTFNAAATELAKYQREQLELLPGGPGSITIPDAEGDVRVQLDTSTTYSFDEEQLESVVAAVLLHPDFLLMVTSAVEDATGEDEQEAALAGLLANLVSGVIVMLRSLGKVTVQVSKVRAFADKLDRDGERGLAGVVRDSIIKQQTVKDGAKFTRKEPVS